MTILHISAECYPAAKAGGLGDVVGALPKYLNQSGINTTVLIPKYSNSWIDEHPVTVEHQDKLALGDRILNYTIEKTIESKLGFDLYFVDIPGLFDRKGIYEDEAGDPFPDETERYIAFQKAALSWVCSLPSLPKLIHCHDHHTGIIPFMMKFCNRFKELEKTPSVLTIHNAQYQGAFSWEYRSLLPEFDDKNRGLLDYHSMINPLAAGIKCCWKLSTVSQTHLEELRVQQNGLENLLRQEAPKSLGILNGIDTDAWDPGKDANIIYKLKNDLSLFKKKNKEYICKKNKLEKNAPLFIFIGRLVFEKGVELLPGAISSVLEGGKANFIFLGSGKKYYEDMLRDMAERFPERVRSIIAYDEKLAHQLYASADFLLMPSRVEPCGLNQMYAMKYGTIPVVRSVGGLKDSVKDISERGGYGVRFDYMNVSNLQKAIYRSMELYDNKRSLKSVMKRLVKLDFSWQKSAKQYAKMYQSLVSKKNLYDK